MSGLMRPRRELPGAGPRVAGIDGELRVDAGGRRATPFIHACVTEVAARATRRGAPRSGDRRGIASSGASHPARGPTQSVGIDGELRVDAGGRSATLLTHERIREAATLAVDT